MDIYKKLSIFGREMNKEYVALTLNKETKIH